MGSNPKKCSQTALRLFLYKKKYFLNKMDLYFKYDITLKLFLNETICYCKANENYNLTIFT